MKDIIVTFTVVLALHKVVYLLWLSTLKDKGKRNSKNVCHGRHMVNSKSTIFSRNVTVVVLFNSQVSVFDNSSCFYNRVRQSDSQTVRQSDSQTVKHSESHTVKRSDCQTVRRSDSHSVTQSEGQRVRLPGSLRVRLSGSQRVRPSGGQRVSQSVNLLLFR